MSRRSAMSNHALEAVMKYGVAWLLGVPMSLILLWFAANQMGCGL